MIMNDYTLSTIDRLRWSGGQNLHLDGLDTGRATPEEPDAPSVHIFASGEGATAGGRTLSVLLDDLRAPNPSQQVSAARAIGRLGDIRAIPDLLETLAKGQWMVRAASAYALGEIAPKINDLRALPGLMNGLGDEVWLVRRAAAWALGRLGDERGAPSLITSLSDRCSAVREAAAWALGEIGGGKITPPLKALLNDPNPQARAAAARALGRSGDSGAQASLIQAFATGDEALRQAAAEGLGILGERVADPAMRARIYNQLLDLWSDVNQDADLRRVTGAAMARIHAARAGDEP